MLKIFKKSFWVPCEDVTVCPTVEKAHGAIARYCEKNGWTCVFSGDDEVVIDGVAHEIFRGQEPGGRGSYGIKCREK